MDSEDDYKVFTRELNDISQLTQEGRVSSTLCNNDLESSKDSEKFYAETLDIEGLFEDIHHDVFGQQSQPVTSKYEGLYFL